MLLLLLTNIECYDSWSYHPDTNVYVTSFIISSRSDIDFRKYNYFFTSSFFTHIKCPVNQMEYSDVRHLKITKTQHQKLFFNNFTFTANNALNTPLFYAL